MAKKTKPKPKRWDSNLPDDIAFLTALPVLRLVWSRQSLGISPSQAARDMGVPLSSHLALESLVFEPKVSRIVSYAKYLRIPLHSLFELPCNLSTLEEKMKAKFPLLDVEKYPMQSDWGITLLLIWEGLEDREASVLRWLGGQGFLDAPWAGDDDSIDVISNWPDFMRD